MAILNYIEYYLGWLLYNFKSHDHLLFTKAPAFEGIQPTIEISSPECGPSGSRLKKDHSPFGQDRFPKLEWQVPPEMRDEVKEFMVVAEDPDAPLPISAIHGLFYAIPASVSSISNEDIRVKEVELSDGTKQKQLNSGWKYMKRLTDKVYGGPRPPLGHGKHRYFYEVIGLKEPLDLEALTPTPKKAELLAAISGKVLCWGEWIGTFERVWGDETMT